MPREIKAPLRYVMEDMPATKRTVPSVDPVRLPKRGRPKTIGVTTDVKSQPSSNRSLPRKSTESIIIPDEDDSDVEIIETPKPSKRKKDEDPDWESERKAKTPRSARSHERQKREKPQAIVSPLPPQKPATPQKPTPIQAKTVAAPAVVTSVAVAPKHTATQKTFTIELYMDCRDEPLSLAQLAAIKKEQAQYEMSQSLIKAAREGRLIFLPDGGTKILDKPMNLTPTVPVPPPVIPASAPTQGVASHVKSHNVVRSTSPDLFIVGETPPKLIQQNVVIPPAVTSINKIIPTTASPVTLVQGTHGLGIRLPSGWQGAPTTTPAGPRIPLAAHPLKGTQLVSDHSKVTQVTPKTITSAKAKVQSDVLAALRQQLQQQAHAKAESEPQKKKARKQAQLEGDESGNWVPLDEYYYGKMEGDPTYQEIKGEHRFKCWYCNKMLYNNVAAMMHIQGHIDSERQVNLDLSDLTQCKHCYKQFDTPFEMQTHIEKVHMNNANVLLCRICEKSHDSRMALKEHMRKFHNACEMPYMCQLCKFRSSMYSDVVDHFKKKHNSSDAMLCMYCLRVFHVRFVNQGWGQTSIFYNHLMKHQVKNSCKKCQLCRLVFLNPGDLKTHRKMDHLPNQKGVIGMNAKYTTPDQVMIKVTEKTEASMLAGGVKSLNVPAVKKIMEHRLSFPSNVYKVKCIECQMLMGIPDHYKKFIQCSMCRFATSCSFAYSNHMMGFHSGQMTAAASHTPDESKLESKLYCSCGFVSSYGNRIANHLVSCSKSSCFKDPPPPSAADEFGQELQDPRKKPDASLLDVLGLIKKDSLPPLNARTSHHESPPPEPVDMPEVTLSTKFGRRPLLLRDSMKKAFKDILKDEKDKNIFEQFKIENDNAKAGKQEQNSKSVHLERQMESEIRAEKEKQDSREKKVTGDEILVCLDQGKAATTDTNKTHKSKLDETKHNNVDTQEPGAENTTMLGDVQGSGKKQDEKSICDDLNIQENEEVEDDGKTLTTKLQDQEKHVSDMEEWHHSVGGASDDFVLNVIENDNLLSENESVRKNPAFMSRIVSIENQTDKNNISESIQNNSESGKSVIEDESIEKVLTRNYIEIEASKNDGIEKESLKSDDIELEISGNEEESLNNDNIEIGTNKNDSIGCEQSKNGDIEEESFTGNDTENDASKRDDIEFETNKNDDIEEESFKGINTEDNTCKRDVIECEQSKNDDFEEESFKGNDTENDTSKRDDIEFETNKNDDIEEESFKGNDTENDASKRDNIECVQSKDDDIEVESLKGNDTENDTSKRDDIEFETNKNDDIEEESFKGNDTENDTSKRDNIECVQSKDDDIEVESLKGNDTENDTSKRDDIEFETNKNDDIEEESFKGNDTENDTSKRDNIECVQNKDDDTEVESFKGNDTENDTSKRDDIEFETNKNDDIEEESFKGNDTENDTSKRDNIECVQSKDDDIEVESLKGNDTENDTSKRDDIEFETNKNDDIDKESFKGKDFETNVNKKDGIEEDTFSTHFIENGANMNSNESETNKKDNIEEESLNTDYTENGANMNNDIESEANKKDDIEEELFTNNDIDNDASQNDDIEEESLKNDDIKTEANKNGGIESKIKYGDIQRESYNNDVEIEANKNDDSKRESAQSMDIDNEVRKNDGIFNCSSKNKDISSELVQDGDIDDESAKCKQETSELKKYETMKECMADISNAGSMSSQHDCVSQEGLVIQENSERVEIKHGSIDTCKELAQSDQDSSFLTDIRTNTLKETMSSHDKSQFGTLSSATHSQRDLSSNKDRPRSRSPDRHRDRRSRSRDRERDREWDRHRNRDRYRDQRSKSRDRDYHRDRERTDRSHNRDRYRDRSRERDRNRERNYSRERDSSRERNRSRERDRKRDQSRERNRNRDYHWHNDDRRYR